MQGVLWNFSRCFVKSVLFSEIFVAKKLCVSLSEDSSFGR